MKILKPTKWAVLFTGVLLIGFYACGEKHSNHEHDGMHQEHGDHDGNHGMHNDGPDTTKVNATSVVYATAGNTTSGMIMFSNTVEGVQVTAKVSGLTPGKHGFHIHEFGDCSAADGTSAGGHFNPDGHDHGSLTAPMRHAGDLGNLEADADGNASVTFIDKGLKLSGPHSIIGHSVIIHANEDDYTTQPTGNAGPRVACGVIGVSK
jgi:superoxide dismutase, Cu-Zn family